MTREELYEIINHSTKNCVRKNGDYTVYKDCMNPDELKKVIDATIEIVKEELKKEFLEEYKK